MCLEDLLENEIIKNLSYLYNKNIKDESLLLILYLRATAFYKKEILSSEELSLFIITELNLPKKLIYKNESISLTNRYSDNCLLNITDGFLYKILDNHYNDVRMGFKNGRVIISEIYSMSLEDAKKKIKSIKGKDRKNIYKYFMFDYINKQFNIELNNINKLEGVYYASDHPINTQPIDFMYKQIYDLYKSYNEKLIERELEDYIVKNNIFDIKILHRQFKVESGIIDLIGMNNKNEIFLIELKVVNKPKDLIWQVNSYKHDLSKIYNNVKVMVVAPKLDNSILNALPNDCEIVKFKKQKEKYVFEKVGNFCK